MAALFTGELGARALVRTCSHAKQLERHARLGGVCLEEEPLANNSHVALALWPM